MFVYKNPNQRPSFHRFLMLPKRFSYQIFNISVKKEMLYELKDSTIHAFLFIRIVFFRFNMDILNFWADIIVIYS